MEMKMGNDKRGHVLVLKKLAREFSNFRRSRGGNSKRCWYPDGLKSLALGAMHSGCSTKQIAEAIGVSSQSIAIWRRASQSIVKDKTVINEAPRELHMVADGSEDTKGSGKSFDGTIQFRNAQAMARLKFNSGVRMVLPVKALSFELLESLSRIGGIRC
jgi:hypothetical protein